MTRPSNTARVFFALLPDRAVREALLRYQAHFSAVTGRAVPADNLHLTLLFLGQLDWPRIEQIGSACDHLQAQAMDLCIDHAGWWPKPGILWLGPSETPAPLATLEKSLRREATTRRVGLEHRDFKPHITLFRGVDHAPSAPEVMPVDWHASEFCLMESVSGSGGVRYSVLARWPLV